MFAHFRSARLVGVVLAILITGLVALTAPSAKAAGTASISGTLVGDTGPVPTICATAYRFTSGSYVMAGSACPDPSGGYSISGLAAGTYKLLFEDSGGQYYWEWWDGALSQNQATTISVADGASVSGKDAVLERPGRIAGHAYDAGGDPVELNDVYAYRVGENNWSAQANIDDGGAFTFTGLRPGSYEIEVMPRYPFLREWWKDADTRASSTTVTVTSGATTSGVDPIVEEGARFQGTVTDENGDPVEDVEVALYFPTSAGTAGWDYLHDDYTDANGHYDIGGVVPGEYRLGYYKQDGGYLDEFWDNAPTVQAATSIVVGKGDVVTKDAQLHDQPKITGVLTDSATGAPVGNMCVEAQYLQSASSWSTETVSCTAEDGKYALRGLTPRTYRLHYVPQDWAHAEEWYQDADSRETAADVVVPADTAVVRDAVIDASAAIRGHLAYASGPDARELVVDAYHLESGAWVKRRTTWSDEDTGDYVLRGLRAGKWKVHFGDSGRARGEWWNDAATMDAATVIDLDAGEISAAHDAVLAEYAVVHGQVTSTIGGSVDATVTVYQPDGSGGWAVAKTVDSGFADYWTVGGLEPGPVRLRFASSGYVTEFWEDAATLASATTVMLPEGLTEVNAVMAPIVTPTVQNYSVPSISGTAQVGRTLTGLPGYWSPFDATFDYSWLANGVPIAGATDQTYVPAAADVGKTITLRVSASRPGYNSASATSAPTAAVALGAFSSGGTTISGTARVGETLTSTTTSWVPSGPDIAYQWFAEDTAIPSATTPTYTIGGAYVNKRIRLEVTASKPGYANATVSSSFTDLVSPGAISNTLAPTLSGVATAGSIVTVSPGSWTPSGVSLEYQWFSNGAAIFGATAARYRIPADQIGKQLSARVTARKDGFTPAAQTTGRTAPIVQGTITVLKKPVLSGKAKVGKKLKLSQGTYAPADVKVIVRWLLDGKVLPEHSQAGITLQPSYVGHTVSAKITVESEGCRPVVLKTKGKTVT